MLSAAGGQLTISFFSTFLFSSKQRWDGRTTNWGEKQRKVSFCNCVLCTCGWLVVRRRKGGENLFLLFPLFFRREANYVQGCFLFLVTSPPGDQVKKWARRTYKGKGGRKSIIERGRGKEVLRLLFALCCEAKKILTAETVEQLVP